MNSTTFHPSIVKSVFRNAVLLRFGGLMLAGVFAVSCNDTPLTSGNPSGDARIFAPDDLSQTGTPLQCNPNQQLSLNGDLSFVVDNSASNAGYQKAVNGQSLNSQSITRAHPQNQAGLDWYASMTDCQFSDFRFSGSWSKDPNFRNFQPLGSCARSWRKSMVDSAVQYYRNAQSAYPAGQRKAVAITKFPYGGNIPTGADESYLGRWLDPVNSYNYLANQGTQFMFRPQGDSPALQAFGLVNRVARTAPSLSRGAKPVVVIVTDGLATDSYQQLQQLLAQSAAIRQSANVYVFMTMAEQTFQVHRRTFIQAMSERNNGESLEAYMALNLGRSATGFDNSFYQRMVGRDNFFPITSGASLQSLLFHVLRTNNHIQCI